MNRKTAGLWMASLALPAVAALPGCSRHNVIPDRLEQQVKKNISFEGLEASPEQYKGQLVVFGGEVLSAKRLEDRTRVEVLQLPLTEEYVPTADRVQSKGRFLAFDRGNESTDPAILQEGTPVTIVGEVIGWSTGKIGESEYRYPIIAIQDMTVWNRDTIHARPYPYWAYRGYRWYPFRPYYWW